jgi:chromosome segregation ATPase
MTVPTGIERKVRQLDNDVQSIYEMLAEISGTQRRQGNRLDEIDGRLASMDGRLTAVDGRLTSLDEKVDTVLGLLRDRPSPEA